MLKLAGVAALVLALIFAFSRWRANVIEAAEARSRAEQHALVADSLQKLNAEHRAARDSLTGEIVRLAAENARQDSLAEEARAEVARVRAERQESRQMAEEAAAQLDEVVASVTDSVVMARLREAVALERAGWDSLLTGAEDEIDALEAQVLTLTNVLSDRDRYIIALQERYNEAVLGEQAALAAVEEYRAAYGEFRDIGEPSFFESFRQSTEGTLASMGVGVLLALVIR